MGPGNPLDKQTPQGCSPASGPIRSPERSRGEIMLGLLKSFIGNNLRDWYNNNKAEIDEKVSAGNILGLMAMANVAIAGGLTACGIHPYDPLGMLLMAILNVPVIFTIHQFVQMKRNSGA
jgi:hypothetical protein